MTTSKLNPKQLKFCQEYLKDLNATEAAKRAGYSEVSAHTHGHRMINNAEIKTKIAKLMGKRAQRVEVSADRVLAELVKIGFSDIREAMSWAGDTVVLKNSNDIPDHIAHAIQSVKAITKYSRQGEPTTTLEVKLYDKQKALDMIARHLGMFKGAENEDDSTIDITPKNVSELARAARLSLMRPEHEQVAKEN